jgi:ABC-type transport system involved in cytochrome c biogenesis ATPase subunit
MGYFAQQSLDVLNSDLTVIEQLQQDFPQDGLGSLRNLAGAFQFSGEDVDKKIRALSGGEKSRLAIARMLYNPPNFLVLDEPTNHLDLATKEMLVDALKDFEGTMIFVLRLCATTRRVMGRDSSQQTSNCRTERDPLKVATFNINNINKRPANLLAWLAAALDILGLQI